MKISRVLKLMVAGLLCVCAVKGAVAREFADIYTECGLGSMIAPNNTAVAAVTNVTWDSGSTAISSNISSPDTCKGGQAKKAAFIHETYPQLERDLARGQGKHLDTLLSISGCNVAVRDDIALALRGDFARLITEPGYSAKNRYEQSKGLFDRLNARIGSDFSQSCSVV
jgi:hypothetical protein